MKGSATLWIGTAVMTRMSVSVLAVSTPLSISAFMMVPSIPMLSASARLMPQPRPSCRGSSSRADDDRDLHAEIVHGENFLGDAGQAGWIDPGAARPRERLAA